MPTELAKVNDVIEYDQDMPPNVVKLRDRDDDIWTRRGNGFLCDYAEGARYGNTGYWPMTVVEVDPEPQPAWTGFVHVFMPGSDDCCNALLMTGSPRLPGKVRCGHVEEAPIHLQPADPSQPVVLRLDAEPVGAVAVVGVKSGTRWERTPVNGGRWQNVATLIVRDWTGVLEREREVTVEFAPPREPRTWPKIESLPPGVAAVEVEGAGVWEKACGPGAEDLLRQQGSGMLATLGTLREMGDVTEVIEP